MNKCYGFIGLCLLALPAMAVECVVTEDLWDRPRQGSRMLALPLQPCIEALQRQPASSLVVHYPDGADSVLYADELRTWLIALGISGARIRLVPDARTGATVLDVQP
jgi:hypothetical protein